MSRLLDLNHVSEQSKLFPLFYIVRPDRSRVPLIALDELSPLLKLCQLPLSLSTSQIDHDKMTQCGDCIEHPGTYYDFQLLANNRIINSSDIVSNAAPQPLISEGSRNFDHKIVGSGDDTGSVLTPSSAGSHASSMKRILTCDTSVDSIEDRSRRGISRDPTHHVEAEKSHQDGDHPSKTKNAMTPGIYGKKKYCTYWIRTGNCDYIQEGCKYLHVIPDEETRQAIGIRDRPRWATEDSPARTDNVGSRKPAISRNWRNQPGKSAQTGDVQDWPTYENQGGQSDDFGARDMSINDFSRSPDAAHSQQQSTSLGMDNNDLLRRVSQPWSPIGPLASVNHTSRASDAALSLSESRFAPSMFNITNDLGNRVPDMLSRQYQSHGNNSLSPDLSHPFGGEIGVGFVTSHSQSSSGQVTPGSNVTKSGQHYTNGLVANNFQGPGYQYHSDYRLSKQPILQQQQQQYQNHQPRGANSTSQPGTTNLDGARRLPQSYLQLGNSTISPNDNPTEISLMGSLNSLSLSSPSTLRTKQGEPVMHRRLFVPRGEERYIESRTWGQ